MSEMTAETKEPLSLVCYSVRDDALILTDEQRGAALEAKAASGVRLDDAELREVIARETDRAADDIAAAMRKARAKPGRDHAVKYSQGQHDAIVRAIDLVLVQLAVSRFHNVRNREALEDRVAELERQMKPRLRVVAPTRKRA